jgi:hypothetical protein
MFEQIGIVTTHLNGLYCLHKLFLHEGFQAPVDDGLVKFCLCFDVLCPNA